MENQPERLAIGLRVQRVGGPEQRFWLTNAPGKLESDIFAALAVALQNTNRVLTAGLNVEPDLFAARAREMAFKQSPFWPRDRAPKSRWDEYKKLRDDWQKVNERQNAVTAGYQRALLQDPNNQEAKFQVAMAYLWEPEGSRWSQGLELLREVAAGGHQEFAARARYNLDHLEALRTAARRGPAKPRRPDDWASLEQAYAEEPNDPQNQYEYASHLVWSRDAAVAHRARAVLQELAASDAREFAPRARSLLAELAAEEKARAALDGAIAKAPAPSPFDFIACRPFLQENFARFVPVRFESDPSGRAHLQTLPVHASMFPYRGKNFCGFRFTVPDDMDGDLEWMYFLAKSAVQKDFKAKEFDWYIIPKTGTMEGFTDYQMGSMTNYPGLHRRFPHTNRFLQQTLPQTSLRRGGEYAIWFAFNEPDLPDVAFALTVASEQGRRRFGSLPLE
jgi:hypothetical protein